MQVKAVTVGFTRAEYKGVRDAAGDSMLSRVYALNAFARERGRIVHLECGHEFQISFDGDAPTHFDCRYCSRVLTIEERSDDRYIHKAEAERRLR